MKNLVFCTVKLSVLAVIIPLGVAVWIIQSVLLLTPLIKESLTWALLSPNSLVKENSIPANKLSETLNWWNLTSPILSAMAPFLPFFQEVRL